jgi:hypothetical protein
MSLSSQSGSAESQNDISRSSDRTEETNFFKLKFPDYASLQKALDEWCRINYVQLVKRTCPKLKEDEDGYESRVYERLYYTCIHFGKPRISKTENANSRTQQVYNACGCECFFHFKRNNGKFYLFNHKRDHCNHPVTKEHWESHPQQRRVDTTERVAIEHLFRLKVPFRNIRNEVKDTTGKNLSDHDLRNIANKQKKADQPKVNPGEDLETEALKILIETVRESDTKNTIKTKVDDDGVLQCFIFTTECLLNVLQ